MVRSITMTPRQSQIEKEFFGTPRVGSRGRLQSIGSSNSLDTGKQLEFRLKNRHN